MTNPRWAFERAVLASGLAAPIRHVLLTLAVVADWPAGITPAEHTPSLTILARATGLGRSTVARALTAAEDGGWTDRLRPTVARAWADKERTRYRLKNPALTSPAVALVPEGDQSQSGTSPGAGPELVPERDGASPGAGHEPDPDQTNQTEELRSDVEQVCRHLADRIEGNGSKRPNITKTWRTAARLMVDNDGRTVDQITKAIDWCQDDQFWHTVILSMPKLREKYDQLRLQAQRGTNGHSNGNAGRPSTTDARVAQALAAGAAVQAVLDQKALTS